MYKTRNDDANDGHRARKMMNNENNEWMDKGAEELFVFKPFRADDDESMKDECHRAALDKLQTLYPGRPVTSYDNTTLGISTDSYYSATGFDTYELGLVDGELPAMRNTRDGEVITFRLS